MRYGKMMTARREGVCVQCHASIVAGTGMYWAFGVRRGSGWTLCAQCGSQYERDLASDDFDLSNNFSL